MKDPSYRSLAKGIVLKVLLLYLAIDVSVDQSIGPSWSEEIHGEVWR